MLTFFIKNESVAALVTSNFYYPCLMMAYEICYMSNSPLFEVIFIHSASGFLRALEVH